MQLFREKETITKQCHTIKPNMEFFAHFPDREGGKLTLSPVTPVPTCTPLQNELVRNHLQQVTDLAHSSVNALEPV